MRFNPELKNHQSKTEFYELLRKQTRSLIEGEKDAIANLANFSSLLYHTMANVNWVGFYLKKGNQLVLGPFQGKPACIRIAIGKGVCGAAAKSLTTQCVANVHEFPGHIPCDSASNSEIVIPIIVYRELIGVLDIDSPDFSRFDQDDISGLESLIEILKKGTNFKTLGG